MNEHVFFAVKIRNIVDFSNEKLHISTSFFIKSFDFLYIMSKLLNFEKFFSYPVDLGGKFEVRHFFKSKFLEALFRT